MVIHPPVSGLVIHPPVGGLQQRDLLPGDASAFLGGEDARGYRLAAAGSVLECGCRVGGDAGQVKDPS